MTRVPVEPEVAEPQPCLILSAEQAELGIQLRRLLTAEWDVRDLLAGEPVRRELLRRHWRLLDERMGIAGVTISQDHGGAGAGVVELAVIAEELGYALFPAPLLGTLGLAVPLMAAQPACAAVLEQVAAGELIMSACQPGRAHLRAERGAGGESALSGVLTAVPDACEADLLLVVLDDDDGRALYGVDASHAGVSRRQLRTLDMARTCADVVLDRAAADYLGPIGTADPRASDIAQVVVAADLLGVGSRALGLAAAYAQQRTQFGRVIGSYQAVKHRCARMLIAVEQARSLVRHAAWCADHQPAALGTAAAEALWFTADAVVQVTADLIRVLGGIGFTWEHEAHLYFRRARAGSVLLGDQLRRCDALADRLLVP